jgi:hypothetical protein
MIFDLDINEPDQQKFNKQYFTSDVVWTYSFSGVDVVDEIQDAFFGN